MINHVENYIILLMHLSNKSSLLKLLKIQINLHIIISIIEVFQYWLTSMFHGKDTHGCGYCTCKHKNCTHMHKLAN